MNESLEQQEEYKEVYKNYVAAYKRYKEYWPELTIQLVPVDAITGWNLFPRDSERHKRLSLWEALRRFHAKGFSIYCPWRIFSVEDPNTVSINALLMSGELKIGDKIYHNSEITREIEEISINNSPDASIANAQSSNLLLVNKTFAQRNPLKLKFHGAISEASRRPVNYLYGPGIKCASSFMVRIVFLEHPETSLLPLKEVMLRSLGGPTKLKKFEVRERLELGLDNPFHYKPLEKDEQYESNGCMGDSVIAKIEVWKPIYIELESTYPDLAKIYLTSGTSPNTGTLVAVGIIINADWTDKS